MTQLDFSTILPYTILTAWACVLLLVDIFILKDHRKGITEKDEYGPSEEA